MQLTQQTCYPFFFSWCFSLKYFLSTNWFSSTGQASDVGSNPSAQSCSGQMQYGVDFDMSESTYGKMCTFSSAVSLRNFILSSFYTLQIVKLCQVPIWNVRVHVRRTVTGYLNGAFEQVIWVGKLSERGTRLRLWTEYLSGVFQGGDEERKEINGSWYQQLGTRPTSTYLPPPFKQ